MMVLDEAHNVKREDGYWASAVLRAAPGAKSRIVLTGTPAPNGYEDLVNLFRFIYPDRSIIRFPVGTLRAMNAGLMPAAVENLKRDVRPFFTRIRKRDLALPPVSEERLAVEMGPEQSFIYHRIERLILPRMRQNNQVSTLVRARLIRLRQAATNPSLLLRPLSAEGFILDGDGTGFQTSERAIAEAVAAFDTNRHLAKLNALKRIVPEIIDAEGKLLIWSYFLGNLALIKEELRGFAESVDSISGATPVGDSDIDEAIGLETRERIIRDFHRPHQTAILIANPQAVGESISLHKAAHTAIYFERDFNAGRFIQSKDRIHRYDPGPTRPKRYIYLVSPNSVEEVIDQRLIAKEERLADLVDTDDIPLFDAAMSADASFADIQALISAYEKRTTV